MSLIKGLIPGRILEGLARYRFLTIQQLVRLGAGEEKGVRTRLQDLMTAKLIERQEFRLGPSAGRLPNVHWLTPKGARLVTEATGTPVEPPRTREIKPAHAWHRMLAIDALMACDRWAENTSQARPVFRSYMQWKGNAPITGVALPGKHAIADAILETTDTAGNGRLYVLEVYCSQYSEGRSSFPLEQLEPYVLGGMGNGLDEALKIPADGKAARILVV
ncbi:replication-relaxation family protein, partial [Ensifer adhaerens]|uniref:replication-relaxation family protein n=1 Tax=Ensifer adhaerens TaxID=106592 RepID=UPI003D088E33